MGENEYTLSINTITSATDAFAASQGLYPGLRFHQAAFVLFKQAVI